jgi:hypothetical protein
VSHVIQWWRNQFDSHRRNTRYCSDSTTARHRAMFGPSSALTRGYLYAAASPMSIFGSLGVVTAGFKTLVACFSFGDIEGAKVLGNMGFEPQGENLSVIMLAHPHNERSLRVLHQDYRQPQPVSDRAGGGPERKKLEKRFHCCHEPSLVSPHPISHRCIGTCVRFNGSICARSQSASYTIP